MVSDKILLIKCFTVLCVDNQLGGGSTNDITKALVRKAYLHVRHKTTRPDTEDANVVSQLLDLLSSVWDACSEPLSISSIVQSLYLIVGDDGAATRAVDILSEVDDFTESEVSRMVRRMSHDIKSELSRDELLVAIGTAAKRLRFGEMSITEIAGELMHTLQLLENGDVDALDRFVVQGYSSDDDLSAFKEILNQATTDALGTGGLKTGWQGLNRMMGTAGSMRLGMFVLVGALTHNYKSGACLDLFRHFLTLNDPEPLLENKELKPIGIYFSAESRNKDDLLRLAISTYEQFEGKTLDIEKVDVDWISQYANEKLTSKGWSYAVIQLNPDELDYTDVRNIIRGYEEKGYEVKFVIFDYLALINKRGLDKGMIGEDVRQLMQRTRVFTSAKNILFITPHQLSQEAMGLKRAMLDKFCKTIAAKNYWDSSKRIANEADLELFLDIVKRDNVSYLNICRGKHRVAKPTPEKYLETYIPFEPDWTSIPVDIDRDDRSITSLSAINADMAFDFG